MAQGALNVGQRSGSSTNQVNGAQIHPISSFLRPFSLLFLFLCVFPSFFSFSQLLLTTLKGTKKLEDNRYAEWDRELDGVVSMNDA